MQISCTYYNQISHIPHIQQTSQYIYYSATYIQIYICTMYTHCNIIYTTLHTSHTPHICITCANTTHMYDGIPTTCITYTIDYRMCHIYTNIPQSYSTYIRHTYKILQIHMLTCTPHIYHNIHTQYIYVGMNTTNIPYRYPIYKYNYTPHVYHIHVYIYMCI